MTWFGLSELQLSLIAIGLLAVLGVWFYNMWLERRHRQQARQIFHQDRQDVLMQSVAMAVESAQAAPDNLATQSTQAEDDWLVRPVIRDDAAAGAHADEHSTSSREAGDGRLEPRWQDTEAAPGAGTLAPQDNVEPEFCEPGSVLSPLNEAEAPLSGATSMTAEGSNEPLITPPEPETARQDHQPGTPPDPEAVVAQASVASAATVDYPHPDHDLDPATGHVHAQTLATHHAPIKSVNAGVVAEFPVLDSALDSEPPFEYADEAIDCVVQLNAGNLISAPLFWSAQRQLLSRLAGRLNWIGLDENSGQWQRLHAQDANSYRRLVAALQLVDRQGAVAADDLALFCDGVRQLAAHYQAEAIVPVVADVVARAHALDAFCAAVDWRLALNLVHARGQGLPLSAIIPLASAANLQRAGDVDDGRLHALDAHGQTQFTLGLLGLSETTAAGLTLAIDVPRVSDGVAAFERMLHLARHLCHQLQAQLVDDQRQPLSDETLTLIRDKIAEFQLQMKAHKIPAGGRRALRLYA